MKSINYNKIFGVAIFVLFVLILTIVLLCNGNIAEAQFMSTHFLNYDDGLTIEQVAGLVFNKANIADCAFGEYGYCRSTIC